MRTPDPIIRAKLFDIPYGLRQFPRLRVALTRYYSPLKTGKLRISSNIEVGKQYGSV